MNKRNVTIFNLECSPEMREQIEKVRQRLGAASGAEVVRRAIRLLDLATSPGTRVVVREKDGSLSRVTIV